MEIYLVGGAVRDELLGRPVKERDWVVVGATPEDLVAMEFQPVGKDFPVFLHPKTHEEYALARTERKTAKGYKGFQFYATPDVTLKEDLKRRDLTINAIAKSSDGQLIDPYNGQADLKDQWLRHVSPAFSEDPVRILRIGRFASTLPNFKVHPDTNALMKSMVNAGEVNALVAERVWKELSRTLETEAPDRFFDTLDDCGALNILLPEIASNKNCLASLKKTIPLNTQGIIRFACLLCSLPEKSVQSICKRYRVPTEYSALALLTVKNVEGYKNLQIKNAETTLKLLRATDALRRPERFSLLLDVFDVISHDKNKKNFLLNALTATNTVDTKALQDQNLTGPEFGEAIYQLQLNAIKQMIDKNKC